MRKVILGVFLLIIIPQLYSSLEKAQQFFEQEKYEETINLLKPLIKQDQNNLSYNKLLAKSYLALTQNSNSSMLKSVGNLKKVKKYSLKIAELDPTDLESRENLAYSYFFPPKIAGGNKKKARELLAEIKQLSHQKGMEIEVEFLVYEKKYDKAEKTCFSYIQQYPEAIEVYYTLGMMYQEQQNYDKAFNTFETHIQKDPGAWKSMYQIGRTAVFSETNLEKGIEFLTKYITHEPGEDSPGLDSAYWRMGMLYELQGKTDQALSAYESGLQINPDNSECKRSIKKIR